MAYITGHTEQIRGKVRTCIHSTCMFPASGEDWKKAHFTSLSTMIYHVRGGQKK